MVDLLKLAHSYLYEEHIENVLSVEPVGRFTLLCRVSFKDADTQGYRVLALIDELTELRDYRVQTSIEPPDLREHLRKFIPREDSCRSEHWRDALRCALKGINIMTPEIINYGVSDGFLYELSSNTPNRVFSLMYGVAVCVPDTVNGKWLHLPELGKPFDTQPEAKSYIRELPTFYRAHILDRYAKGEISAGKSAELLGLTYDEFEVLCVSAKIDRPFTSEELERDLKWANGQ